jgi:hypothetical protein
LTFWTEQDRERRLTEGRPLTATISEAPPEAATAQPIPISREEVFRTRGPAFDASTTTPITLGEAEQLTRQTASLEPLLRGPRFIPGFERGLERTRGLPIVGPSLARSIEFSTSPAGIAAGVAAPALTLQAIAGETLAGTAGGAAEEFGAPRGTREALEIAGAVAGPFAAPSAARAARAGATRAAESVAERGGLRALPGQILREEVGATRLPERGYRGAQALIETKEKTLTRPGRLTQFPGVRQALSVLNPAVSQDRSVLVAANARQAAQAGLETKWAALRRPAVQALKEAFDGTPYVGPADNPFKRTLKDFADNPRHYEASPGLEAAARAYDDVSDQILREARGEFGVNIGRFQAKEGGFYLPTTPTRESIDEAIQKVSQSYTSAGVTGKGPRARTRLYASAYERAKADPKFQALTDIDELTSLHDRALASMAGGETFRLGAGGKTRLEVMRETHPKLAAQMEGLRNRLSGLRATVARLNTRTAEAIDNFLADPDSVSLAELSEALDVKVGANALGRAGRNFGMTPQKLSAEIQNVRAQSRKLRPAWEGANLEPYVLNRKTFRYHQPEQSLAIDRVLTTKAPIADSFLSAIDEVRLTAFGGDISPLTIQGALGILTDPIRGARSLPGFFRELMTGDALARVAEREPELVRRFAEATGRPLGSIGPEFVQARRGIERLPGGSTLNRRLMGAVEYIRYNQWKSDRNLLKRLNPQMADDVADAEAANTLSKVIPALNPTERGVSVLQARFERAPVISTSFLGGPAALVKDFGSALAKLGASRTLSPAARFRELTGREQLALIRGLNLAGSLSTLSVGSYVASGYSPEEAVKRALDPDPKNGRFLSVAFGKDFYIPVGGPFRSLVRGIAPQEVSDGVYVPFAGTYPFLKGKVTPPFRIAEGLLRNETFRGRKVYTGEFPENVLRGAWFAVNSVLPLTAGATLEQLREGETDIATLARTAIGQFAGQDVREASSFERLNRIAQETFGADYYDLDVLPRQQLEARPEVQAFLADIQRGGELTGRPFPVAEAEVSEQLAPLRAQQEADDAAAQSGAMDIETWKDNQRRRLTFSAGIKEGVKKALGVEFEDRPETRPIRAALDAYFNVTPDAYTDPLTREVDWPRFFDDQDAALAPLTPEQRGAAIAEVEKNLTPFQREFREASRTLAEAPERYNGLPKDRERDIREFLDRVDGLRRRWLREMGRDIELQRAIQYVGEQDGHGANFVSWAGIIASPTSKKAKTNENPEWRGFLLDNEEAIAPFFPSIYSRELLEEAFERQGVR